MRTFVAILFLLAPVSASAASRVVLNQNDSGNGSLRRNLQLACDEAGDDVISFYPARGGRFVVQLETSLAIPEDCQGKITLTGRSAKGNAEVLLDGSEVNSGNGILIVRSDGNEIRGLSLAGYSGGGGLVIEGSDNVVEGNFIGVTRGAHPKPNRIGMKITGDWNIFRENTVTANDEVGIVISGNANALEANLIGEIDGECPEVAFPEAHDLSAGFVREISHPFFLFFPARIVFAETENDDLCGNGGPGIRISGDRNLVGGDQLDEGNRILFNQGGGILVESEGYRNRFSRNVISANAGPGIELDGNANGGIEPLKTLKVFPVEAEVPEGDPYRYTLFGEGEPGTRVELYLVPANEPEDSDPRGEAGRFLEHFIVSGPVFSRTLEGADFPPGSRITSIVCDDSGNCSEFSENALLGQDKDHDGLLDGTEDENGDGKVYSYESDPLLIDTDGDGLPDSLEDRDQNGEVEKGETDPFDPDTDADGLSDFIETGGDGDFDTDEGDTNPLSRDMDGDGIMDGDEDLNQDGVIQLGESDPREPDIVGKGKK